MTTEPEKDASHIGARIAAMRKLAGIKTAKELVQKINDESVTLAVIQSLESGRKKDLRVSQLVLIADALNVSFDDLLGGVAGLQAAYADHNKQRSEFSRQVKEYTRSLLHVAVAADSASKLREVDTVGWLDTELVNQSPAQMTTDARMFLEAAISGEGIDASGHYLQLLLEGVRKDAAALDANRLDDTAASKFRHEHNARIDRAAQPDG